MTLFRYDKTFEGLLTCLFDAYSHKTFPDKLIGENVPELMFATQIYEVPTQKNKSERVWKALENKLPKKICNMIMCVWLSELEGSDELLMRYMRKVFDSKSAVVLNFADPDILEMSKIALKVGREGEHVRQFIRFQKLADGSYFAPIAPKYNALPLAIAHLQDRFADQQWLVYDSKRRYGYYYDLKKVVEVSLENDEHLIEGKLDEHLIDSDEKLFQELWKNYFKSLAIKERINPKLQRQHMPKRFWKYLTEKSEQ